MGPRRRQAWFSWINTALVGSTVVIGTSDHRVGSYVQVDSRCVYSGHSYFGARQDRSGHAERKDSGDDDCSPDAHGLLHGECPGQRLSWQPRRYLTSHGVLSCPGYFMHACNRNFFFFRNCKPCDNCRCLCTGKIRFSVYGKIRVSMHCKVLCKLHGAIPEQQEHLIITIRCLGGKHCVR
jgi:hypothetical protein